jgi:hypothetical protein
MRRWFFISIACMASILCACTSTFLVNKDGMSYFFGSNSNPVYEMLCTSGDFEKVLLATHLSTEMKEALYKYNCSDERSGEKVKQIYLSMTPEQKKDLRNAFKAIGYAINNLGLSGET